MIRKEDGKVYPPRVSTSGGQMEACALNRGNSGFPLAPFIKVSPEDSASSVDATSEIPPKVKAEV